MSKNEIIALSVSTSGFAVVIVSLLTRNSINVAQAIEITITFVLVLITAIYVKRTSDIANATKEQADETKKQRYDTFRPVIDIVEPVMEPREMATLAYNAREGIFPKDWPCRMRNIGVGPAIELYSFIEGAKGKPRRWDFGAIPVAIGEEEMGYTREMRLFLETRNNHRALVAYYKDVYGRTFESSREVTFNKEKTGYEIGPLKIRAVIEDEFPK